MSFLSHCQEICAHSGFTSLSSFSVKRRDWYDTQGNGTLVSNLKRSRWLCHIDIMLWLVKTKWQCLSSPFLWGVVWFYQFYFVGKGHPIQFLLVRRSPSWGIPGFPLTLKYNDDEVRRVCKTPGDPWGCTRQHSQRNGLPLPFPWNKYWSVFSSRLCCSLISSTFSCFSLTDLRHLPRVQYFWSHPSTAYGASLSSLLLQLFPALYLSVRIDVLSSRVRNIAFAAFLLCLLLSRKISR